MKPKRVKPEYTSSARMAALLCAELSEEMVQELAFIARDRAEKTSDRITAAKAILDRAVPTLTSVEHSEPDTPRLSLEQLARWLGPGATVDAPALPSDAEVVPNNAAS